MIETGLTVLLGKKNTLAYFTRMTRHTVLCFITILQVYFTVIYNESELAVNAKTVLAASVTSLLWLMWLLRLLL